MARLTSEDLLRLRWVSDPQLSPDGSRIASVITEVAPAVDQDGKDPNAPRRLTYRAHLYVSPPGGREPVQFTAGPQRDGTPRWSPDGAALAFVSDRGAGSPGPREGGRARRPRHLWTIPTGGGEARQITEAEHDPAEPVWSPDGQWIAFAGKAPKGAEPESDVKVITRLKYKFDGEGFWDGRYRHIFVMPAAGGSARQLTSGDFDHREPAWSPDGRWLAFVANRSDDADFTNITDVWVMPAEGGEPRRLTSSKGPCSLPSWSPDGTRVAYVGHDNRSMFATSTDLWIIDVGGNAPRNLTRSFDRVVGHHVLTDMRAHPVTGRPVWSADGRFLFCVMGSGGETHLVRVTVETGNIEWLTSGPTEVFQVGFDAGARRAVVAVSDVETPGDLWLAGIAGGAEDGGDAAPTLASWQRLTDVNGDLMAGMMLSRPERFQYEGADGWLVEGWVLPPADREPGRRYPTILQIHGGPHAAYGWGFFHEFQVLAAEGFALVYVNPRGSQGYGQTFAAATHHDWGGKDFEDIMRGLDAALDRFAFLDPNRLGVAGGSYGGFMTNWVIGHTDRFKAAVTMRSIANNLSQWGMSDLAFFKGLWEFPGDPWDNPTFYWERSPLAYASKMTTPTLIIHSEQDLRCPIGEGEQLFVALKKQRQEAVFLRFPDESHDLSRKGQPEHRVERLRWIVKWFADHLGREAAALPRETGAAEAVAVREPGA